MTRGKSRWMVLMCSTTPPAIGQGQGLAFPQGGSDVFVLIFILFFITLSIKDDKYSHMSGKSARGES